MDLKGIGSKALWPTPDVATGKQAKDRYIKNDTWQPFLDLQEIYPGNRGMTRHNTYDVFDIPFGVELKIETADSSEPIIEGSEIWEGGLQPYYIWEDEGKYHMLYGAVTPKSGLCYANSEDGYNWNKPKLRNREFQGSLDNNIAELGMLCVGIFQDPLCDPSERFKALSHSGGYFDADTDELLESDEWRKRMKEIDYQGSNYKGPGMIGRNWLTGWISPNGKNWSKIEEPVANNGADGGIIVGYDPFTKEYFSYIRPSGVGRRAIGISKTKDFRNWPPPRLVMYPDHHDDLDVSFYGANYFKYPGLDDLHCTLVQIYHQIIDSCDNQLAVSRDGLIWYRHRESITPLGESGSGFEGMNRTWGGGLVVLPDGTWATPHEGSGTLHNSSAGDKYNVFPDRGKIGQIRWGRWKPHRLCGIEAKQEGKFTIQTVRLNGNELRFNYKCNRGGWINVELLKQTPGRLNPDAAGEPGFEFEKCDRLTGNSLDSVVTWDGNSDISSIGETVAIRISMFDAKIFAYKISGKNPNLKNTKDDVVPFD